MSSNPSTAYFHIIQCIRLEQAKITDVVLTGRFSSSPVVVHSASYPPGKANRAAAYQWQFCGLTQRSRKSFAYIHYNSSFLIRYINYKIDFDFKERLQALRMHEVRMRVLRYRFKTDEYTQYIYIAYSFLRCCGVVSITLASGSIGHGFESEHRLFSHHRASAFSKMRSLANAHWTIQFVDCCSSLS